MATTAAVSLQDAIKGKLAEVDEAVQGLSEDAASRKADAGWSVKTVLCHLIGDERESFLDGFRRFAAEDNPTLKVEVGVPHESAERQRMTTSQLLDDVHQQYDAMAAYVAGLSDAALARRATLPDFFKDTPLTANPTLADWANGLVHFHMVDHINQLRALRQQVS